MSQRNLFIILTGFLILVLTGCGGGGKSASEQNGTENDFLQGDVGAPALQAIPDFFPDPIAAEDYFLPRSEFLVKGLQVHKSRLVVKPAVDATVDEINALLQELDAVVAGAAAREAIYIELNGDTTEQDLVRAKQVLEASESIEIVVEDVLVDLHGGG